MPTSIELFIVDSITWRNLSKENIVEIGFMKDSLGQNLTYFPRIPIVVDRDTIQTLFDTGAMVHLSKTAQKIFNTHDPIGASFIVGSIFDKWASIHPDWEIIKKGDSLLSEDMIRVPKIYIAQQEIGPVWFARRKDANFTEYMSKWMDQTVYGAIGGSGFQHFQSIIIDYNEGLAYFEK